MRRHHSGEEHASTLFGPSFADVAQLVEHVLGKDEVIGSIPIVGSSFVEKDTEDPRAWDARSASH